ncbi:MAG: redoxin family protein [Planctomycetes bacterium]|nr:redoxin family protein [Planctomycetota bacterium]
MRRGIVCFAMVVACSLAASARAHELHIGDAAPSLDVTKWVKGAPVDVEATKDKGVVVVEFWATWCGPCVAAIPHLTELQQRFRDKGVTFVAVTKFDEGNTLQMVEEFVAEQGDKMGFTVAFDKEGKTYDAFMKAAGQGGIPTSFVIDKSGRVAWIGHPMGSLEEVLDKVVSGGFDIRTAAVVSTIRDKMWDALRAGDHETRIRLADAWIALEPTSASPHMTKFRTFADELGKPTEALAAAKKALALAGDNAATLASYAQAFVREDDKHGFNALALDSIKRAMRLDPESMQTAIANFRVLATVGREGDAIAFAEKAIKHLGDNASDLARFARVLADPKRADRCTNLAIEAVDLAIAAEPDEPAHLSTKFKILATCKKDVKAAVAVGRYFVEKAADEEGLLNNFAWELLTDEAMKGNYDDLALAAAERCDEIDGGDNWMYVDTLALAKFETGARAEAARLQRKVIELIGDGTVPDDVRERLERFEAAK